MGQRWKREVRREEGGRGEEGEKRKGKEGNRQRKEGEEEFTNQEWVVRGPEMVLASQKPEINVTSTKLITPVGSSHDCIS